MQDHQDDRRRKSYEKQAGFSLVEVLLALAVGGLALMALAPYWLPFHSPGLTVRRLEMHLMPM